MRLPAPLILTLLLTACGDGEPLTPPDARLPDAARYRGEVVDGLLQGAGRLDYDSGAWFAGRFLNGQFNGPGEWHGLHGETYRGDFAHGQYQGLGVLHYADGSRYAGQFKASRFDGEGHYQQADLEYRGQFKADRFEGLGTLQNADGSSHHGQFHQGQPNGSGVRRDAEGNQLLGQFVNGALEGQGSWLGVAGDRYDGAFAHDEFHGQGRFQSAEGDVWQGQFQEGRAEGLGHYQGLEGEDYLGQLRDWRFHGQGTLTLADGSQYQGAFANGRYEGEGRLTLADGRQQSGVWRHGRRVRDAQGQVLADPLELGLLNQGRLLDQALAAVPASTPAIELYSLALAGDGQQSVFLREAEYLQQLLTERFAAHGQISLINHREHLDDRPMATRENLKRALQILAERSGEEDILFIYLTSHGSADHQLALNQPRLQLEDLPADDLARLLAPLKNRHKVVVISACYSGGFLPSLQDEKTLVMTAARADRTSFGCSEDADLTYFGRALLANGLQHSDDLPQAFERARQEVAQREKTDDFPASEPQLWAPPAVVDYWRQWRALQARSSEKSPQPAAAH